MPWLKRVKASKERETPHEAGSEVLTGEKSSARSAAAAAMQTRRALSSPGRKDSVGAMAAKQTFLRGFQPEINWKARKQGQLHATTILPGRNGHLGTALAHFCSSRSANQYRTSVLQVCGLPLFETQSARGERILELK